MKFYFSGTGNSLYVAKNIGDSDEELISISKLMDKKYETYEFTLKENESIGFIYPIYAWGPPKMVIEFINKTKFLNFKDNYVYAVVTCGENIGNSMKVLDKSLINKGMKLNSGFSIVMPNNYVIFGDVDSDDIAKEVINKADNRIKEMNEVIRSRESDIFDVVKGHMPGLLTAIVNPLFAKQATSTKSFYANDNCNGCGICENVCNCNTIKVEGKPVWGKECTGCLACLHLCPTKAINYGKGTEKKGRYVNPLIKRSEMNLR
ncbi:NADH-plastoquinone oxidoreductase subunit [uncultured Clostridium sp.]|uniref:EFR1 family ferrodoxin n=1 Tax=uncultured Clostridium sp. TaxID=59620 RepID=UPI00082258E2|nr:EFR1 family ferrodoxin [uncultured Clostridium sp.]SCJ94749.1 NADH-plastoquinone oxidoreductase subunit [uncultured Clostridium sp.]